jgi:hypothetical protein
MLSVCCAACHFTECHYGESHNTEYIKVNVIIVIVTMMNAIKLGSSKTKKYMCYCWQNLVSYGVLKRLHKLKTSQLTLGHTLCYNDQNLYILILIPCFPIMDFIRRFLFFCIGIVSCMSIYLSCKLVSLPILHSLWIFFPFFSISITIRKWDTQQNDTSRLMYLQTDKLMD